MFVPLYTILALEKHAGYANRYMFLENCVCPKRIFFYFRVW